MYTEQKKRIRLRVISVFALLAFSASVIGISSCKARRKADSIKAEYSEQIENMSEELTAASSDILSLDNENNALSDKVEALENNISGYLDEIEQLNTRILVLEEDIERHNETEQTYLKQIDVLSSRFEKIVERYKKEKEKNSLIESENKELDEKLKLLGDELDKLRIIENSLISDKQIPENITSDILENITSDTIESNTEQSDKTSIYVSPKDKLIDILTTGAPNRWYEYPLYSGSYVLLYPKIIAFNYYDIESGESFSYNSDTVLYSASLIKAPYIYSVLREISDFEKNAERDENGNIVYHDEEYKYDLSEIWIYDSATMLEEGSGEIMNMPDGTQMSWLDLFSYSIRRSDNVAFAQIISRFGKASFNELVYKLGICGTYYDFMDLSADDCVKFLSEIYSFFSTDDKYAALLKEWMTDSKHPEMISDSYAAGVVAHKYGWDIDAFHDMAIVYDEHPYILVIMTDLDSGGDEAIAFYKDIINAAKLIHNEIHS